MSATVASLLLLHALSKAQVLTPPFLQNVGTDHISILCEMGDWRPVVFEYGESTAYGAREKAQVSLVRPGSYRHAARLKGLTPGTTYHFRMLMDGRPEVVDRTFKTAPEGDATFSVGVCKRRSRSVAGGGLEV